MKYLILKIIGKCNNNCRFCMIPEEYKKTRFMSLTEIKLQIDQIKSKDVTIDFFGGEPTLHPYFFQALKYVQNKGYKFTLASNARMLAYEAFAKKLNVLGVFLIRSSLHGHTNNLHEYLTRVQGSFKQTIAGFKNIIKYRIPIQVNIVMNKYNINFLENIAELLLSIGIKQIKFSALCLSGNMRLKENKELIVDFPTIKSRLLKALYFIKKRGGRVSIEKLPVCVAPEFSNNFVIEEDREIYTKTKMCIKCIYYSVCMGIEKGYLKEEINFEPCSKISNNK